MNDRDWLLMPMFQSILELTRLRLICLFRGHVWRYLGDTWVGWRHPTHWKCDRCAKFEIR